MWGSLIPIDTQQVNTDRRIISYTLSTYAGIDDPHRNTPIEYWCKKYFLQGEITLNTRVGFVDPHRHTASEY